MPNVPIVPGVPPVWKTRTSSRTAGRIGTASIGMTCGACSAARSHEGQARLRNVRERALVASEKATRGCCGGGLRAR